MSVKSFTITDLRKRYAKVNKFLKWWQQLLLQLRKHHIKLFIISNIRMKIFLRRNEIAYII